MHSYRALARQPSAMNLMVTALTEARIGHLAAAVFSAQAVVSHADLDDVAARLVEPLADATASWRDLAGRMAVAARRRPPSPTRPAPGHREPPRTRDHRSTARRSRTGKGRPAYALAFRVDLPQTCPMLRNALAHAADAARVTRDLAVAPVSPIVGPSRALERQASSWPAMTSPGRTRARSPEANWCPCRNRYGGTSRIPATRSLEQSAERSIRPTSSTSIASQRRSGRGAHGRKRPAPSSVSRELGCRRFRHR